jgi:hypothetical protein
VSATEQDKPIPIACHERLDIVLVAETQQRGIQLPGRRAHERGPAVGEDGAAYAGRRAPRELRLDRSVADRRLFLPANHRAPPPRRVHRRNSPPSWQSGMRLPAPGWNVEPDRP